MNRIILSAIVFLIAISVNAQTKFGAIFQNHMVLQRNTQVHIWGVDKPNIKVVVSGSWGVEQLVKTDKNGKWKTTLKTVGAGGPYNVVVKGSKKVVLEDVLLGEVWICTGQSNMAMPLKGGPGQHIEGSNTAILNSSNSSLRFVTVDRATSRTPLENMKGAWQVSSPKTAANFSAVGYAFGLRLQQALNVPVGLISSNVGGTPAQAWTPKKTIVSEFPEFKKDFEKEISTKRATVLYNGMIHPLIPYTIKGAIWYQGEGNRWNPEQYTKLFPAMIKSWRHNWQLGDFPFYFVQIAPFGNNIKGWVGVQESQLKTMLTVPNSGMAVINDIGYQSRIHPPKKIPVGQRLALWALAKDYGMEGIDYSGPVYKTMKVEDGKALLSFDYAPLGITSLGKPLTNFEVQDEEGNYHSAQAKIVKRGALLQVWNDAVKNPKSVRYGWKSYIEGCLFNTAGLPASCFDTKRLEDFVK
ncbi:sialate O-acetylesterase [Wenyingzhuangia sp. IMCC45574]